MLHLSCSIIDVSLHNKRVRTIADVREEARREAKFIQIQAPLFLMDAMRDTIQRLTTKIGFIENGYCVASKLKESHICHGNELEMNA